MCSLAAVLGGMMAVGAADPTGSRAFDWPQWQGPERNAISREKGLLQSWLGGGPPLVWKAKGLGGGYCAPSVTAGRIYGMSYRGDDEVVWALDEATGKELWHTRIAAANRTIGQQSRAGSSCTPAVDGARLYVVGVSGDLVCLETATGKSVWHKNLVKDFGGHIPRWGYSESPLVDGDKVLATPGDRSATLVALDKKTGRTIWKAQVPQGDEAAYSSIIAADVHGQREYIQFLKGGAVGVAAGTGKFLWRYDHPASHINCSTPVYHDNQVFVAAAYGKGGGLANLIATNGSIQAKEVYFTKNMKNHHGGMVLIDGYLYGANGGNGETPYLVCLNFKTGEMMWEERSAGKGSLAYADGRLYYRTENGPMLLVEANPKKYVELGRFEQPDRTRLRAWPHPVIANGKLYLRDQDVLLCYDVKQH
jgi:outer membrane protein assembly factor BamB